MKRRKFIALISGAVAFPLDKARAQAYPSRAVTFVVPFAPGGPTDTIARIVAEGMRSSLGQPTVVENVTGAGGSVGTARVARAEPDGYTVAIGNWGSHVANGAIYSLSYDLLADFTPVSLLPAEPLGIVAKKAVPADNLKDFIAWLKANPNKGIMCEQWCRWSIACWRPAVCKAKRHAISAGALSRRSACLSGCVGWASRHDDHWTVRCACACSRRQCENVRRGRGKSPNRRAGNSIRR